MTTYNIRFNMTIIHEFHFLSWTFEKYNSSRDNVLVKLIYNTITYQIKFYFKLHVVIVN